MSLIQFNHGKVQYCIWFSMLITLEADAMSRSETDQAVKTSLLKGEKCLQQNKEELRQFRMNDLD
uniref:Uncharacterized protein n=1 Tax=Magallana gigas TaxID=29159 RepID=K1Q5T7_MAGGI